MAALLGLALAALFGLLGGLAAGLFGVGGGVVTVPALTFLLGAELPAGRELHAAKAAALFAIAASAAIGVAEHRRQGHVELRLGALLGLGGVAGAALAAWLAEGIAEGALRALFGLLLVAAGARLWFEVQPRRRARAAHLAAALPAGLAAGVLAGLFGVGGGILLVPFMVLAGVPVHAAVGTSLVAVLLNAAAGTAAHAALGYGAVLLGLGVPLALGSALGIALGARAAARLRARALRRAFGVFLALVGAAIAALASLEP